MRQCVVDEDLADSAAGGEEDEIFGDGGVGADECKGREEFVGRGGGDGKEGEDGCVGCDEGREEEVDGCEGRGEEVLRDHHLRAGVRAEGGKDVVLGAVGEAVEEEVDSE